MEAADFSGYATVTGLKCSDGRTITPEAFRHMDGMTVPLVWQHGHSDVKNMLGHAVLKWRDNGMYTYGFFNSTPSGKHAKELVEHKDIKSLSIYANQLVEKSKQVLHGEIREVSLVLSGANPKALIDYVRVAHSDGEIEELEDEAIIHSGLFIEFEQPDEDELEHAAGDTVKDVYEAMTPEQQAVVHYMLGTVLENGGADAQHSGIDDSGENPEDDAPEDKNTEGEALDHQEGTTVVTNVFEQKKTGANEVEKYVLTHADIDLIQTEAKKAGNTLKGAVESFALQHGINNIDILFPDARSVTDTPDWDKRRTEWVAGVINGTKHTPFSRIKSFSANLTLDEARAKGYVKGTLKKEEFFAVLSRSTYPSTIYKKQKLDRDDIIDITDFDVVRWMKGEMRLMLDEEIARAVLIGDGREPEDDDKISETNIRPIATDDQLYAATVYVNLLDASSSYSELMDEIIMSRRLYKGSGVPTFYTTQLVIAKFLTLRDTTGQRMYRDIGQLAAEMGVDSVVAVEVMENEPDLVGIMVNLQDYTIGADKGGEVNMFDDFDIDYNQHKYLIETRISGALTKIRSAIVFRQTGASAVLVTPVSPSIASNVVTPATTTGVTYKRADTNATVTTGAPITLNGTTLKELTIYAVPASSSYYIENNVDSRWTFTYTA